MEGRASVFFDYFKDYVSGNDDIHYLLYGSILNRMDQLTAEVKEYPIMVLEQPEVVTRVRSGIWFNEFTAGVSILDLMHSVDAATHMEKSGRMFDLMGDLIKKIKDDQKSFVLTHAELEFRLDEVDSTLVANHVGWRADFKFMLKVGGWMR
jgi:hypothetical protein